MRKLPTWSAALVLVLNIGKVDSCWIESMLLALVAVSTRGIPVVLDPMCAGATRYRNASIELLLKTALHGGTGQRLGDHESGGCCSANTRPRPNAVAQQKTGFPRCARNHGGGVFRLVHFPCIRRH